MRALRGAVFLMLLLVASWACSDSALTLKTPPAVLYGPEESCQPAPGLTQPVPSGNLSAPLVIDCRSDVVLEGLNISSSTGDCLNIVNSVNVTIRNSQIGPCAGNAIEGSNNRTLRILDSYLHSEQRGSVCCDHGDNVWLRHSSDLLIQGNVLAYGEANIELQAVSDARIVGNFMLNPLGPYPRGIHVQVWGLEDDRSADVLIEGNYLLSSTDLSRYRYAAVQEDAINVGYSDRVTIQDNIVRGGRSPSGCAYLIDLDAQAVEVRNNLAYDIGQCGIGVSSGRGHIIDGNRVYSEGSIGEGGNVGIYVWNQGGLSCGRITVTNNVAVFVRSGGAMSSWWNGGGCSRVNVSHNTWDEKARQQLAPVVKELAEPASLPPRPAARKADSPYSR